MCLETEFPTDYFSKYSMVTFREDMGYFEAMTKGRAQDKAILNMINDNDIDPNLPMALVLKKINQQTQSILEEDEIAKTMHH